MKKLLLSFILLLACLITVSCKDEEIEYIEPETGAPVLDNGRTDAVDISLLGEDNEICYPASVFIGVTDDQLSVFMSDNGFDSYYISDDGSYVFVTNESAKNVFLENYRLSIISDLEDYCVSDNKIPSISGYAFDDTDGMSVVIYLDVNNLTGDEDALAQSLVSSLYTYMYMKNGSRGVHKSVVTLVSAEDSSIYASYNGVIMFD